MISSLIESALEATTISQEGSEFDERMDLADTPDRITVPMTVINMGDLEIFCPFCECMTSTVYVGITTVEEESDEEQDFPNMEQMGVVAYPCGDRVVTPCLAEKVAHILNAREDGTLRLSYLHNLVECKEHGVEFPGQS